MRPRFLMEITMGLDMYLNINAVLKTGGNLDSRIRKDLGFRPPVDRFTRAGATVSDNIGYWHNFWPLHNWLLDQGRIDDDTAELEPKQIVLLQEICQQILNQKPDAAMAVAAELLAADQRDADEMREHPDDYIELFRETLSICGDALRQMEVLRKSNDVYYATIEYRGC